MFKIAANAILTIFLMLFSFAVRAENGPVRIYISADMEGIAAAVTGEQLRSGGAEYDRFREIMTGEVLAAIEGARAGGADEIVVSDSHGSMQNILVERLPDDIILIRGRPRKLSMMEGIQEGDFDGVIFLGYHAGASNTEGVRAHTMSSGRLSEIRVNGVAATEGYINALTAGEFGAPVILVTGDDAAVEEVAAKLGDVEKATVKRAIGFHAAATMTPAAARKLIREKAERAVSRIGDFKPLRAKTPVELDVTFHYYRPAEILSWLPSVTRTGARSIRYRADSMAGAQTFLSFMMSYSLELTP